MFPIRTALCSLLLAPLASPNSAPQAQRFELDSVSVQPAQVWPLNREILFSFNEALDFSTVNLNTVRIYGVANGLPGIGNFTLRSPSELVFQPSCPTLSDFSDSGLQAGETYQLFVPDATNSPLTLTAASGKRLAKGALVTFSTPVSTNPADLFEDELPGPPSILLQPADPDGSSLSTGAGDSEFFQLGGGGIATPPAGFLAPNNLYSDLDSRVRVLVRLDQSLLPTESNINSDRIRLEYSSATGSWHPLPTKVELIQSCGGGGATLSLEAAGVFPQDRDMRVWIGSGLQDITGDPTLLDLDHLQFHTATFLDDQGNPSDHADEWLEEFENGASSDDSLQDEDALLQGVPALWSGGRLTAAGTTLGTGGPGGEFDFRVPPGTAYIINTVSSVIFGGPDGVPTTSQVVINGVVDLRNLYVPANSTLIFSGPNPATILATGTVEILGTISVDGRAAAPVFTLNNPTQPEIGAAGNCGGGQGGVGSWETTQVTQRGGDGQGAFGVPSGGGQGGESGWSHNVSGNGVMRRAAGGGGGRFGHDQLTAGFQVLCQDQSIYGLDIESGFPGADTATSSQGAHLPYGGLAGQSPFVITPNTRDDFYGRAVLNFRSPAPLLIRGELDQVWAGAGGGAGGDATFVPVGTSYPPNPMVNNHQDKGAGGGGGAGAIEIYSAGDVVFGPFGRLTAIGGHGSGGENTAGINRVGGGSGGGSGGHIVIHTGGLLDLSNVNKSNYAIDARGGQGGEGASGMGGASIDETANVNSDAKHIGSNNGTDNPWEFLDPQCAALLVGNEVIRAAGGDGGPGVVQLHVGSLQGPDATHDIAYPAAGLQRNLIEAVRPAPVGFDPLRMAWRDHLLPDVGAVSQGQSKWIALGNPQAAPNSAVRDTLELLLEGTDPATGLVRETAGVVDELPPILAPANPVELPGLPNVASSTLIYFDAAGLGPAGSIYRDNPSLLKGFDLELAGVTREIVAADVLPHGSLQVLAIHVEANAPPLGTTGQALVRPRYFRVLTGNQPNQVPAGSKIRIELQVAEADSEGKPDTSAIYPATDQWATDPAALTAHPANGEFRFLRFRITFDLGGTTPPQLPGIDSIKLPFRF